MGMGSNRSRDTSWEAVTVMWEMMVLGGGRGRGVKGTGSRNMGTKSQDPSYFHLLLLPREMLCTLEITFSPRMTLGPSLMTVSFFITT